MLLQQRLGLKLTQKPVLTQSLRQLVKLLALNKVELKEEINQELVANPVLEAATEEATEETPQEAAEALEKAPGIGVVAELARVGRRNVRRRFSGHDHVVVARRTTANNLEVIEPDDRRPCVRSVARVATVSRPQMCR